MIRANWLLTFCERLENIYKVIDFPINYFK